MTRLYEYEKEVVQKSCHKKVVQISFLNFSHGYFTTEI